jgi:hypothetical protein
MSDLSPTKPWPHHNAGRLARPRFGKIPAAIAYCGFGRSKLYEAAGDHPGLFRKSGKSTLVDFDFLDRVLDGMPSAEIKPRSPFRRA